MTYPAYHYIDNSRPNPGIFGPGKLGWRDPYWDAQVGYAVKLGVGFAARQPIGTASVTPLHIDGWLQHADQPKQYHHGYIRLMDRAARETSKPPILYLGHLGGDTQDWSDKPWVKDRPYKPAPTLASIADTNKWLDAANRCISPHLRAGGGTSWIYIDGSASMTADSREFAYLNAVRAAMQAQGRAFGIESPPELSPAWAHLRPFSVAATWGSFINRLVDNPNNPWHAYTGPKLVFLDSDGVQGGDIGGWSGDTHRLMAGRFVKATSQPDTIALMSFNAVVRGGFNSIDQWLTEYGAAA